MVECWKCGTELDEKAKYCWNCGVSVKPRKDEFKVASEELVKTVKRLIHEGNVRRIVVTDMDGEKVLDMPLTFGVVGTVLAPWLAALGVLAAMAAEYRIKVERR